MLAKAAITIIKAYQFVSKRFLKKSCRFYPTCSQYMIDAINEWGPLKGIWLGLKRIARCHPWGGHGHDPVPSKKDKLT